MERAPEEHALQTLFHTQCVLRHIDIIHSKTMPSHFTLSLQKKMRNIDNYLTRQMKIMAKLYAIDQEAMIIFEDAFNAKVDEVVSLMIKDFVKVEE
jgi:hypothetical protein